MNLEALAAYLDRARAGASQAALLADHDPERAEHAAEVAKQAAQSGLDMLLAEGVRLERMKDATPPEPVPLHLLDTEDTRALLVGLGKLLPVAERIDAERGRSWPEPVGGSAGWDIAEDLAQLIARLELEVYGPSAAVTGARE